MATSNKSHWGNKQTWCTLRLENDMIEGFLKWWQSHPITSMVIAGGSFASALAQYVQLGKLIREWWVEDDEPVVPLDSDLERVHNDRFGFSFDYPRHWNRKTSTDNDGHIITHPNNSQIEIRGWGTHNVLKQGLKQWAEEMSGHEPDIVVTEISVTTRTREPIKLEGRRVTTKLENRWFVQVLLEHRGVQASVLCACPKRLFPKYEKFFVDTCHSLSFTDEPGKVDVPEYDELLRSMPDLMNEMRGVLLSSEGKFVREFFILPNHRVTLGGSSKPRFILYEEDFPILLNQIDLLAGNRLLKDVTPVGNNSSIYRMTEKLVEWLLATKSFTQEA